MSGFISQIGLILLACTCLFAWLKGGSAERAGASLIGGAWVASLCVQALTPGATHEIFLLIFDFLLAFGLLAMAIRYASLWLGVAMILQGVILALHSEALSGWSLNLRQYVIALNVCSIGMLAPIAWATAVQWVRSARAGGARNDAPPPAMPSAI